MSKKIKTTKKQFAEFKKWCRHYIELFGLKDWTVHFVHGEVDKEQADAQCFSEWDNRAATIYLNDKPTSVISKKRMRETACHEIVHIALAGIRQMCLWRFVNKDDIYSVHEGETQRMASVILDLERRK